jgi:hypothetical protein
MTATSAASPAATVAAKSKITRSWSTTLTYAGVGIVCAFIGVAIFLWTSGGIWLGSIALGLFIVALICLWMAAFSSGQATCPGCGKALSSIGTSKNEGVFCEGCHKYLEGTGGELWVTDPNTVAKNPLFTSPLPETFTFPAGCCVCGKPETHRVKVSTTTQGGGDAAVGLATGGNVRSSTRISVEVPHCDEHKDGALLTGTKDHMKIRFRSYPYLRAFCEANHTEPC